MTTYDPLLSGPLNLYNVTLSVLTALAVAGVILMIVRDAPGRIVPQGTVRRAIAWTGTGLLGAGAVVFVALSVSPATEDIAGWGVFYLLPAALLAALAALSVIRPLHAGAVLVVGAALAMVVVGVLGVIAGRIDPRWVEDGMDAGSLAGTTLFFAVPAGLTGFLLLLAGAPAAGPEVPRAGTPHHA